MSYSGYSTWLLPLATMRNWPLEAVQMLKTTVAGAKTGTATSGIGRDSQMSQQPHQPAAKRGEKTVSELTTCNYCNLNSIKRRAKRDGLVVTTKAEDGGTAVYVHPPDVKEFPRKADGEPNQYWSALLMEITGHCVC